MKAPRSRQEATSGALPLSSAVASSAQRASWKEWRSCSGGAGRLAAARTAPRSGLSALRASAATSIGSRSAASTTAQSSSRPPIECGATTAGQASAASARSSAPTAVAGWSREKTSTAASSPMPNGSSRRRSSEASMRPPRAPARTSPARRRSVSRATRRRISSSATTATACCRISRSKSPRPPESRTITTQAWGGPPPGEITGWASARPATEGWAGTKGWPSPAWPSASLRIAADRVGGELAAEAAPGEALAAAVEDGDGAADGGGDRRRDFLQAALLEDQPLEPPLHGDAALQHLVLLVDEPGEGLLGDRDERRRVGHLEEREVALLGLVDQRFRQLACG